MAMAGEGVRGPAPRREEPGSGEIVQIHSIGSGGVGVGTFSNGKTVFVPRAAPGDKIRVRLTREKDRWAYGWIEEVVEAGTARRRAPCPLYQRCGGCALQHLEYEDQLLWKGRIVADAFSRIGGLAGEAPTVQPSPKVHGYRNRVTFTLRRLDSGRVVAGFHDMEDPNRLVDVHGECLLPAPPLSATWQEVRGAWGAGASRLPRGDRIRLTLRTTGTDVDLVVRGGWDRGDPEAVLSAAPTLRSIWKWTRRSGLRPLAGVPSATPGSWEGEIQANPIAFAQVNSESAKTLVRHVIELTGDVHGRRVVDAYCGVGAYGRTLATRGAECVGIEMDPEAVGVARTDAPEGWSVVRGKVEDSLGALLPAHLVLLNPPRRGLHERIPRELRQAGVPRIIYVSCDPATLARDLKRLGEGYRMDHLEAFDLFPQTAHVECVAHFTKSPEF